MTKQYSAEFKEETGSTSGKEPIYLLEITHPALSTAVRVARATTNVISNGSTYIAMSFNVTLPDDIEGQLPRAILEIDNVGRELTQWIDQSQGGKGAKVRVMQIMPDTPDILEYDATLDLIRVRQNSARISGEIGYEDTLNLPALPITYRPDNTPGLF